MGLRFVRRRGERLLEEEEGLTPSAGEKISAIRSQSEKLQFLIDSLVKMSRLENGILKLSTVPTELNELMEKADCPAAYTLMSAGCVGYDNPRCLGMGGMHGSIAATAVRLIFVVAALSAYTISKPPNNYLFLRFRI